MYSDKYKTFRHTNKGIYDDKVFVCIEYTI